MKISELEVQLSYTSVRKLLALCCGLLEAEFVINDVNEELLEHFSLL